MIARSRRNASQQRRATIGIPRPQATPIPALLPVDNSFCEGVEVLRGVADGVLAVAVAGFVAMLAVVELVAEDDGNVLDEVEDGETVLCK